MNYEGHGEPGESCEVGEGHEPVVGEDGEHGAAEPRSDEKIRCRGGDLTG